MIRFAPQAASASPAPGARQPTAAVQPTAEEAGRPLSPLLIPDLDAPVAASDRRTKPRGARKPKATATEPAVQLDLAT